MDFYKGSERILYILIDTDYLPIGCLTSDSFNEETDFINTTTQENDGWETSRPTTQRFSVDFDGLIINTVFNGGDFTKISYDSLVALKRSRTLLDWKLANLDEQFIQTFKGYIQSIGDSASTDDMITFSCSIVGYGKPDDLTSNKLHLLDSGNDELVQDGNDNIIEA